MYNEWMNERVKKQKETLTKTALSVLQNVDNQFPNFQNF